MLYNRSFAEAIAHLDCNAFFASVEQAYNPGYKGKPVMVAGMGGGCVITASYEARKLGVKIGTPVFEAKRLIPNGIFLEGDFRRYLSYNRKILGILAKYGATIEASSIDECFLDLKGLRRLLRKNYPEICLEMKEEIKKKLGITVSIGLSVSKTLAKVASDFRKPDGLTVVSGKDIEKFLSKIELSDICGIGHNTLALLHKFNIRTPLQFINSKEELIKKLLGKVGIELQKELKGEMVYAVSPDVQAPKSLARTRSFTVSTNQEYIYSELIKNIELAFWELRRQNLKTKAVAIMLRTKNYKVQVFEIPIGEYINCQSAIHFRVKEAFRRLYQQQTEYRSTGIITTQLLREELVPPSLFESELENSQTLSLFSQIDRINDKYGNQTITFASAKNIKRPKLDLKNLITPFLGYAK
jgi:nucleotidyltransferase/DNA polymerase involved in DNA repair